MIARRSLIIGLIVGAAAPAWGAPAPDIQDQRLQNRLELWANYASRTRNMVARYTLIRRSSLLNEPLHITGTLIYIEPDRLVFRDDGMTGSITSMASGSVVIDPIQKNARANVTLATGTQAAVDWLHERLVRVFAAGDGRSLVEGARTHVPRGRGYRLDLMPPRGSQARKELRGLTLTLDPVAGAVTGLHISEAQGDAVEITLTDHRQNVDETALTNALGETG